MKMFVVKVKAYLPYAIEREYTERCTDFSAAIGKAIRKYKKDERIRGKHIEAIQVHAGGAAINVPKR